ncbi:unnamed protein product [Cuscuta epithymum]|uniref:Uncharacterized protein n=1 Tax=Cuscuta epithymum TaxID=186058 RepID=A0AAV0CYS9_9ASTE|nr:unnamed protein product [Cuscuta epithymum]CAH9144937.1 unnamed protein product [Cuscuta epithymum]
MAAAKKCFLLSLVIALCLASMEASSTARRLMQTDGAPQPAMATTPYTPQPAIPSPQIPSLPNMPTATLLPPLPAFKLPNIPLPTTLPTAPKLTLPPLPANIPLPTFVPNFPGIPTLSSPPPSN